MMLWGEGRALLHDAMGGWGLLHDTGPDKELSGYNRKNMWEARPTQDFFRGPDERTTKLQSCVLVQGSI